MRSAVIDPTAGAVRNRCRYPQPTSGQWGVTGWPTGASGTITFPAGTGRRGGAACVRTWTALPVAGQPSGTIVTTSTFAQISDVVPGQTYTAAVWVKLSTALPVTADLWWLDSAGNALGTGPRIGTTGVANAWERRTVTATAPANAAKAHVGSRITNMDGAPAGFVDQATDAMLVAGTTAPGYADGSFPGWQWTGTANASESVGYARADLGSPAAMFDVLRTAFVDGAAVSSWPDASGNGHPLAQGTAANQPIYSAAQRAVMFDGVNDMLDAVAFGQAQPYTLYVVAFVAAKTGQSYQTLTDGSVDHSTIFLRDAPNPDLNIGWEINAGGTSVATVGRINQANPSIVSAVFNGSLSNVEQNGGQRSATANAGNLGAMTNLRLGALNNSPGSQPFKGGVRAYVIYASAHDDATRKTITRQLARDFGVTLPDKY